MDSKKSRYREAGVPTARCHKVPTIEAARAFLSEVGYPVISPIMWQHRSGIVDQ